MFKFKLARLFNSFRFALRGVRVIFQEEQNFSIQVVAAALAVFFMFYFDLTWVERVAVVTVINLVLILEIVNTAIEKTLDIIEPNFDPRIGKVKDLAAAAVLLASLGSIAIGLMVFLPYFRAFLAG